MKNENQTPVTVEHEGETFTLRLGFNAMCDVEEELGRGFLELAEDMRQGKVRLTDLLAIFHACFRDNHPGAERARVVAIVESIGPQRMGELIGRCVETSPVFAQPANDNRNRRRPAR